MTTDKHIMRKITVCVSFILAIVFCFASCSLFENEDFNYDHVFDSVGDFTTAERTEVKKYKYYDVVVSSDCTADVYEAADRLCDRIESKPQLKADVYYDFEISSRNDGHTFIFVGVHDNDVCRRAYHDFKSEDYRYSFLNGVFVVGGVTDGATVLAIERFIEEIVDKSSSDIVLDDGEGFIYRHNYPDTQEIKLNGFALSQYKIIYPVGDSDGMLIANRIKENIEERFGYTLSVGSDSESDQNARSICIGRTVRANTYGFICSETQSVILPYSTGISIISDSLFGLDRGMAEFFSIISNCTSSDIQMYEKMSVEYNLDTGSVVDFDFVDSVLDVEKILFICDTIRSCEADIIRFHGMSSASFEYIKRNLVNDIICHEVLTDDGESIFYLFKQEKVSVDTAKLDAGDSSICLIDTVIKKNDLEFTISELYVGKDASLLGDAVYESEIERLIVFDDYSSDANEFISASKTLKKCQNDALKFNVIINGEYVELKKVDVTKNGVFEITWLDFAFFYE